MITFHDGYYPILALLAGVIVNLILDIWKREDARLWVASSTTLFLGLAIGSVLYVKDSGIKTEYFHYGDFFVFFSLVGMLSSMIVIFVAWRDMNLELDLGVFFSLLLLANIGGVVVASANHMVALYVGYELISLPSYSMAAFRKRDKKASEAALKFFLLGALSSAILVYGLAMYYGATSTFAMGAHALKGAEGLQMAAVVLITAGSGFKIGIVPFHFWIGDVYSGSPSSVVVWLAASSKKMAFAFVAQLFFVGMIQWRETWGPIFIVLSIVSILLGNIAATIQTNVMRILAYSTIAQAGYILIGYIAFAATSSHDIRASALGGIGIQIIAHVLMKGAAIVATFVIIDNYGGSSLENFKGLFYKNKLVSSTLTVALFSLMGLPPFLGAFGKWFLFKAAVEADMIYLTIVGLVGSAISIFYYMKIVTVMAQKPTDDVNIKVTTPIKVTLVILTTLTTVMLFFVDDLLLVMSKITTDLVN